MTFNPNATGTKDSGVFALPYDFENSKLILIPIPWDVTTSYGKGTAHGPMSIYECSKQIDLVHKPTGKMYQKGIFWQNEHHAKWIRLNETMKSLAMQIQETLEAGKNLSSAQKQILMDLNEQNTDFNEEVFQYIETMYKNNKLVGIVGGDHSSPLSLIKACSIKHKGDFSILHIDAHADLRKSYQGFEFSHASIMRNVMDSDFAPKSLVQIGIRDYCPEEDDYINNNNHIHTFFDRGLKSKQYAGTTWRSLCEEIVSKISTQNVYLSVDIDGFTPTLCPNTGTPVPGGLEFNEFTEILSVLKNNKKIIGFDLCEVSPSTASQLDCWDGNVGSRVLYDICCYALATND